MNHEKLLADILSECKDDWKFDGPKPNVGEIAWFTKP